MCNYFGFLEESINEGYGLRSVIFFSGCKHNCFNCHMPKSHDFNYGKPLDEENTHKIIKTMKENILLDGLTLCGGDPFFVAKDALEFTRKVKKELPHFDIWSYTGFTYEEILNSNDEDMINLLKEIDVLIDGRFVEKLKDLTLKFRGSRNQRMIDVKKSLELNKVIEIE